mgnify:CR=1 FL=1
MKTLLSLSFLFLLGCTTFAQSVKKVEAQLFWETNIQSFLDGDLDAVVEQTEFPIAMFDEDLDEELFRENFPFLFDELTLEALAAQSYRDIQILDEDPSELIYMVSIYTETQMEDEILESMTMLYFKKFEGKWKLFQIEIAG